MCHPTCRDPRPPEPGVAARVAARLDRAGIEPAEMSRWLIRALCVRRFSDLCYSHASAVLDGMTKGLVLEELRGEMPPMLWNGGQPRPQPANAAHNPPPPATAPERSAQPATSGHTSPPPATSAQPSATS